MSTALTNAKQLWTTDPQRTFSGSAPTEAGGIMEIVMDSTVYTVTIAADGSWSWQPPFPLAEGPHNLSVRTIDRAGNVGAPSLFIVNVDLTAPDQPLIIGVDDNAGDKTGPVSSGQQTDDRTPTLKGVAEPDSIVRLYNAQNQLIGSVKASSNGYWEITPTLADGEHSLYVTATDGRGYVSQASETFTLTVADDAALPAPGKVEITHAQDNAGAAQGKLLNGALTDDTTPTLRGTAPAGSNVLIQYRDVNGQWVDGGYAMLNGTEWSWTPDKALGEGNWEFRANAGNGWTDEFTLEIDLTPQSELSITHAWDDFGINTGLLHNGAITDDRTPTLNGRAEANSLVYIHFRNALGSWELLGSVQAGADGNWAYETDRISPGSYQFSASDNAKTHNSSSDFALTIANDAGLTPQITSAFDNEGGVTGQITNGGKTDDTTPEIRGTAEANSIVHIKYQLSEGNWTTGHSVKADSYGKWIFVPEEKLSFGNWIFSAYQENSENESTPFKINILPDIVGKKFTEDFNSLAIGNIINSSLKIDGATLYFNNPDRAIVTNQGSRHLLVGADKYIDAKLKIVFDNYAKEFSFDILGIEQSYKPATINVFDKNNNIIYTTKFTQWEWKNISFSAPDGVLIDRVEVNITNEYRGIDIDNIKYTAAQYKDNILTDSILDHKDNQALSNDVIVSSSDNEHVIETENTEKIINLKIIDILNNGEKNALIYNEHSQIMVNGEEETTVYLEDILTDEQLLTNWTQQTGTVTIAGVQYEVYSHNGSDAELLVQEGVKVELV
ncbi:Ig-like domain-containing protein [Pantoea dispersa]|uniref:Ig-like domain-containing protein n=1 Tax=Pantoea dispersa TaxID=59814 RepID=UPI0032B56F7B